MHDSTRIRNLFSLLTAPLLATYLLPTHLMTVQVQDTNTETVIDAGFHHLGDDPTPEWPEASEQPEGSRLDLAFEASAANSESILIITQRHVDNDWAISINDVQVGSLAKHAEPETHYYPIPAGTLLEGQNHLSLVPDQPTDDIVVGNFRLAAQSFREYFDLQLVQVRVTDGDTGEGLPVRVTVTNPAGELVDLFYATSPDVAVRKGVAYTAGGDLALELPTGEYLLHATRGMEWGLDTQPIQVLSGRVTTAVLSISREVDTKGYVAADTHIHTLTFSGHGDSSMEERVITLAGEGVELAIATDHNHNTDYRAHQAAAGLNEYYTPVTGNEVTTENGHFNAFPLDPQDEVPPYEESDWVKLVDGIRAKGAQVVILNHPRWPAHDTGPFGVFGLDRYSGERISGTPFNFDGMELVNSTTNEPDPHYLLEDWFALLNRGEKIAAVGSSDSHTVGDPVGQGRTYVKSSTDVPSEIDVGEACSAFRAGQVSVSHGIFTDVRVNMEHGMGSLVPLGETFSVDLRVAAPAWVHPEVARFYLNGEEVSAVHVPPTEGLPTDIRLRVTLENPGHDAYLVCFVTGPGIEGAWWRTLNPYTLGATNPVYLDADRNGRYDSPRDIAKELLEHVGTDPADLEDALFDYDDAVAVQALHLARLQYLEEAREKLRAAAGDDRDRLRDYLRQLGPRE